MGAASSCIAGHGVRTLFAHVDDAWRDPAARARALERLLPAERQRHDRFRRPDDRDMFLLGRAMSRTLVGDALGMDAHGWAWREGPHGRPEVAIEGCPLSFNLAHSGGMVVCAISPHGLVGVDVEDRRRAELDRDLVARCCAPLEIADIESRGDEWQERFLDYWTLKEAYLKARGLGITVHLPDLCFVFDSGSPRLSTDSPLADGADWSFQLVTLGPDHVSAVAASVAPCTAPQFAFDRFPVESLR